MEGRTPNKKDLLYEIAGLRERLAEAQKTINGLKGRKAAGQKNGNGDAGDFSLGVRGASDTEGKRAVPENEFLRFHSAFAHSKAAIAIQDNDGRITEQNAAHRTLLGYPNGELKGKTPGHYLAGGMGEFGRTRDELLHWGSYFGETRCRTRTGRWVDAEISMAIVRNSEGDTIGYTTFIFDVTQKKRMEGALRESEERFTTFMNNSFMLALMCDARGRYVYVNRAFEEYVGKPSAEILGKTPYDIWPKECAEDFIAADQVVLSTGRSIEKYEKTVLPRRDTKEWLAIRFPFHDRKRKAFVGCVSIDVTERKSLEEQLRQSQKMEAVGRLAGGIAHDFNNLLTIITGYSELLLDSAPIEEEQRSKIEEIKKAGERAALLTRQLLAFSRKQVLAPRVLDLNVVIENLRKMIERLIGEDIEFVTIPYAALGRAKADPGQVEQIIMNLVVNARDAMPQGGKLTIETANVEFDEEYARSHVPSVPGHYVMVAVGDTGTGMDPGVQKHIFEPFFTTKETGKGTGLGLATAYGIVKQSGGFIWVYSEVGVGTVFKIYFPRVLEENEVPTVIQHEPEQLKGTETILVAEDEVALRTLICETLERFGYKVLLAADGEEAVRLSEQIGEAIHLLIADVVMPRMSGREVAEHVTAARPKIEVLYISGYTDDAIIHHGAIGPNIAFLQKPFTPAALARKVRQILEHKSDAKS
ncbi:MAG: PAS domain-containing sensor histidine kinase [Acidobacteria bacterium]|nr:MAG: PAS domain-containing sensor histidine kinase [Acidobacteriota bacterium]